MADNSGKKFDLAELKKILDSKGLFKRDALKFNVNLLRLCMYIGLLHATSGYVSTCGLVVQLLYVLLQGTLFTGIWVLAHECGHGAAYESSRWCDTIGFILHEALMTPYFSWQQSHAHHHSRTNHEDEGDPFSPPRETDRCVHWFVRLVLMPLFGWPAYLLFGVSGSKVTRRGGVELTGMTSHIFVPNRSFGWSDVPKVLVSNVVVVAVGVAVYFFLERPGLTYFWPLLINHVWLISYTFLHHTHPDVPHYGKDVWKWDLGALCTVDRPYNWFINYVHFNIGTTHVVHHLFSKLPHYNAVEATKLTKEYLKSTGTKYHYDSDNMIVAYCKAIYNCRYAVGPKDGIKWYRK